jgi:hypothetical protein
MRKEQHLDYPYYLAARFQSLEKAGETYFPIQQIIFEAKDECDLSAYRIRIEDVWHVVVLGEKPPDELHVRIEAELTNGVLVTIREDALNYLQDRRAQAILLGPWVEAHYYHPEEEK